VSRVVVFNAIAVVLATALAIVLHAALPAPVDGLEFDSLLVKLFGFPIVAVSYFLLLFTHCAIVVHTYGRGSNLPKLEVGVRFGLAFALLYLLGMQEVVVEASPFAAWGFDFVVYQLFMGVGDALPVLLLCMSVAFVSLATGERHVPAKALSAWAKSVIVASFTLSFFVQRTIGHTTGIVDSNIGSYPFPTLLWTALFGAALGCGYILLYPVFSSERRALVLSVQLVLLTVGANWMLFNGFIGLLFSGAMPQMLFRSGLDTAVMLLTSLVVLRYLRWNGGTALAVARARPGSRRARRGTRPQGRSRRR
jgi:hypothetical protein